MSKNKIMTVESTDDDLKIKLHVQERNKNRYVEHSISKHEFNQCMIAYLHGG